MVIQKSQRRPRVLYQSLNCEAKISQGLYYLLALFQVPVRNYHNSCPLQTYHFLDLLSEHKS